MTNLKSENATVVRIYIRLVTNYVMIILKHAEALSADYQCVNRSLEYKSETVLTTARYQINQIDETSTFSETIGFVKQSNAR